MNTLQIILSTEYTSIPSHCKIYCCDKLIFYNAINKDITIDHTFTTPKQLSIKIIKDGKNKNLVDNKHIQTINIKKITVNGIDLKIHAFGQFQTKNNPYVEDHLLQTTNLTLNGEWTISTLEQPLVGTFNFEKTKHRIPDSVEDCDIACFGCSQTYGVGIDKNQTWPLHLGNILGVKVKNFGIPGSNINQITAFIEYFCKNYKTKLILFLLPHSMRRQIVKDNIIENALAHHSANKEFILHGEEHSIINLSCSMSFWLEKIPTKILISSYSDTEYALIQKTQLSDKLLPYLEFRDYPLASDNLHFGAEYCKEYASSLAEYIKKYNILN